jgi:hypothetical protein
MPRLESGAGVYAPMVTGHMECVLSPHKPNIHADVTSPLALQHARSSLLISQAAILEAYTILGDHQRAREASHPPLRSCVPNDSYRYGKVPRCGA